MWKKIDTSRERLEMLKTISLIFSSPVPEHDLAMAPRPQRVPQHLQYVEQAMDCQAGSRLKGSSIGKIMFYSWITHGRSLPEPFSIVSRNLFEIWKIFISNSGVRIRILTEIIISEPTPLKMFWAETSWSQNLKMKQKRKFSISISCNFQFPRVESTDRR